MINELFVGLEKELKELKERKEAPEWMTIEGLGLLKTGYLGFTETPRMMWERVSNAAASYYRNNKEIGEELGEILAERFFNLFWKGWLGGSTPVLANMGTANGYPISCFSSYVGDTRESIFSSWEEIAWMTSMGGGTAVHVSDIRPRGASIKGGSKSSGVVPWLKVYDSLIVGVAQGNFRRGNIAAYLDIDHPDFYDFVRVRKPFGEQDLQCQNIHHAVTVSDSFMQRLESGDTEAKTRWSKVLQTRRSTGEPYILFLDTVNKANPECYQANNLDVKGSNLCIEICLHTSEQYSLVCCLASLNLAKYDEWKSNSQVIIDANLFLDAVIEEFIQKAEGKPGLQKAVEFSKKSRAVGLGVMGYHTLLQQRGYPFESEEARKLNKEIFERISYESLRASKKLALLLGEPDWCKGFGLRNTHRMAIAPTKSNSTICGNVSEGIEALVANQFTKDTKGAYPQYNPELRRLLESKGLDTDEVWGEIIANRGSVKGLSFLTAYEQDVFRTVLEINQLEVVKQAATRQKWIDQSQSLNLYFPESATNEEINKVHYAAWKLGVKSLYYQKGEPSQKDSRADVQGWEKYQVLDTEQTTEETCSIFNKDECSSCS